MTGDQRSVCDLGDAGRSTLTHEKVMISASDQGASGKDAVTVRGLFDFYGAIPVQAFGESTREHFRHVLDDDDSGARGRHGLQKCAKSLGAAGGGADGNDFVSR